jgi:hypothetical protein
MLPALVVLWLAAPAEQPEHRAAIAEWAMGRGFSATDPSPSALPSYSDDVAREAEALLEEARAATPSALGAFERLDALLATHPELPQASWLLAERYALEAQYRAQDGTPDPGPLRELTRQSGELEGARAAAFGVPVPSQELRREVTEPLEIAGLRPGDEALLDGMKVVVGTPVSLGRHHAQVFRQRALVWVGWVELGSPPRLAIPDTSRPCSAADLSGTTLATGAPVAGPGVRCFSWAVAALGAAGGLRLALCHASRCDAWQYLASPLAGPSERGPNAALTPAARPWPVWVTWSAIGLGAAAGTALVLWRTGAFESHTPATEFVFTGPSSAALRF